MTNRNFQRRVATLFTLVQATPAARVLDWPQLAEEKRARQSRITGKTTQETSHANK